MRLPAVSKLKEFAAMDSFPRFLLTLISFATGVGLAISLMIVLPWLPAMIAIAGLIVAGQLVLISRKGSWKG